MQDIAIGKKRSKVKDVEVGVRISHAFDDDVDLTLFGPNGASVELSSDNGGDEQDYGSGSATCAGEKTVFNDEASTPIATGSAPFGGQFQPEEPLSAFDRSKLKGVWRLVATDDIPPIDDGTLHCFELDVKYKKKKRND